MCADPPDRVEITSTITSMLRYECRGPFRVELRDANGARTAVRDTLVSVSVSLPGVTAHWVASCTETSTSTITLPAGQSSFEVYLKADGQAFGTATLTATAAQVATAGQAMVEVHPQPVDHLEFTSPPRTISAGQCSTEQVTLELRDAMNRRTDVDSPTTITLTSSPADLNDANLFFSDAACAVDGSTPQLQPGQGAVALHLTARRAGSFVLTATPSAGQGITQQLTVVPGAASKLAFTNAPVALRTTESCSAALFTVQLRDAFDNPVTATADLPIRVSVSGLVNVTLHDGTGPCTTAARTDFTIAAGTTSVSFRARGMTAPPNVGTIEASAGTGGIADASQALTISSGFASRFVMTGAAQSTLAGQCSLSPFTLELQDSGGNVSSSPVPVTFTLTTVPAADSTFRFYGGAGCLVDLGGQLTVPAGQSSATFYFRGNRPMAAFEIRASSGALSPPATFLPGNSIRPGPPAKLVFVAPLSQTAQAGACTASPYRANVLDLFDNSTSFSTPQTVSVTSNPPGVTVGASSCAGGSSVSLAANATQATFSAQHTVTSPGYSLTATVGGFSTAVPASLTVTPGPSTLVRELPTGIANVPAGACQQITLSRRDAFGNPAPTAGPTPVTLSYPAGTSWGVFSSTNCTGPSGAAISMNSTHTVSFSVSPRTAGNYPMTATVGAQSAVVDFQVVAAPPSQLVFSSPVQTIPAGSCSASTIVTLRDAWGNTAATASNRVVSFTATPTGNNVTFYSNSSCGGAGSNQVTMLTGTSTVTAYFRGLNAGTITLTADSAPLTPASQVATIQ